MSKSPLKYKSKINKIRSFALFLIFFGMIIMYGGILAKNIPWLMFFFFGLGILAIIFSTIVYFWIGLLSTRAVPIICPSCEKPTKVLGIADACMHCHQPLTLEKSLEGKEFDDYYNSPEFRRELKRRKREEARQQDESQNKSK